MSWNLVLLPVSPHLGLVAADTGIRLPQHGAVGLVHLAVLARLPAANRSRSRSRQNTSSRHSFSLSIPPFVSSLHMKQNNVHFAKDNAAVLTLRGDVVDLGHKARLGAAGKQHMVHVPARNTKREKKKKGFDLRLAISSGCFGFDNPHWKQVEEASLASRGHGVGRVVNIRPGIGALRKATVCQHVKQALKIKKKNLGQPKESRIRWCCLFDVVYLKLFCVLLTLYGYWSLPRKTRCSKVCGRPSSSCASVACGRKTHLSASLAIFLLFFSPPSTRQRMPSTVGPSTLAR
jgi:hypothetical protein